MATKNMKALLFAKEELARINESKARLDERSFVLRAAIAYLGNLVDDERGAGHRG